MSNTYRALAFYVGLYLLLVPVLFSNDSNNEEVYHVNQVSPQEVKKISKDNLSGEKKGEKFEEEAQEETELKNNFVSKLKEFASHPELRGFKFSGKLERKNGKSDEFGMKGKIFKKVDIEGNVKSSEKGDFYKIKGSYGGAGFEIDPATGRYSARINEKILGQDVKVIYNSANKKAQMQGNIKPVKNVVMDINIDDVRNPQHILFKAQIKGKHFRPLITIDLFETHNITAEANIYNVKAFLRVYNKSGKNKTLTGVNWKRGNVALQANAGFYNGKMDYEILAKVSKIASASIGKDSRGNLLIQASANHKW